MYANPHGNRTATVTGVQGAGLRPGWSLYRPVRSDRIHAVPVANDPMNRVTTNKHC